MNSERQRIRSAFDAAASDYDASANLQREVASALAACSPIATPMAGLALDAGCGTGYGLGHLARLAPGRPRLGLDLAPAMAAASRARGENTLCGDIEALPLADTSVSFYWSSLAWQWCDEKRAATEAFRVLTPGGSLLLATLGPETLAEVREAFSHIDPLPHVRDFAGREAIHAALAKAGFEDIRIEAREHFAWAPDLRALLAAIRRIGAGTVGDRRKGLLGRRAWKFLVEHYEQHRRPQGLPARYDVLMIHASKSPVRK